MLITKSTATLEKLHEMFITKFGALVGKTRKKHSFFYSKKGSKDLVELLSIDELYPNIILEVKLPKLGTIYNF